MSLSNQIREVLRKASGPMTAGEVREELGGNYSSMQVGGALFTMTSTGEAIRDRGEGGHFTFLLDSSYKPKRSGPKPKTEGTPPPKTQSPPPKNKKLKKAKPSRAPYATGRKVVTLEQAIAPSTADITIPRASLRAMAIALMAMHPQPMQADLRDVVLGALTATL